MTKASPISNKNLQECSLCRIQLNISQITIVTVFLWMIPIILFLAAFEVFLVAMWTVSFLSSSFCRVISTAHCIVRIVAQDCRWVVLPYGTFGYSCTLFIYFIVKTVQVACRLNEYGHSCRSYPTYTLYTWETNIFIIQNWTRSNNFTDCWNDQCRIIIIYKKFTKLNQHITLYRIVHYRNIKW